MKGLLMKSWKAKAIMEDPDRLWQTRRLMKPQPPEGYDYIEKMEAFVKPIAEMKVAIVRTPKPRYKVGEVVYIKEAYYCPVSVWIEDHLEPDGRTFYKLDNPSLFSGYWKTPLFMPAWAARTFRQITEVRVQKLQEITYDDCLAEGLGNLPAERRLNEIVVEQVTPKTHFAELWDSENPKYTWESNPFIFAYTTKRWEK